MAITVTPLGANSVDGVFGGTSPWAAGTGVTLGTGDIVLFVYSETNVTVSGVTIGGVTATKIGDSGAPGSANTYNGSAWIAKNVSTSTGNISISTSGSYNMVGANWYLVTGEDNTSGAFTNVNHDAFDGTNPSLITATVPSGGVGLVSLGAGIFGATTRNPTTWTSCVASGNTTLESIATTGNAMNVAGNYTTTSGSVSPGASGTNSYAGACTQMMMVTFSAAAGGDTLFVGGGIHFI